jgi:hypothetical protein
MTSVVSFVLIVRLRRTDIIGIAKGEDVVSDAPVRLISPTTT